jgi:hypothetical protein
MRDPIQTRAQLVIEESRQLRAEGLRLHREHAEHLRALRLCVLESAMLRAEAKAYRDNEE